MVGIAGTEVVGYVASALVVLALTRTSVVRLRILSLLGSLAFITYGALISSIPILITNTCIALINIWFLRKEFVGGAGGGFALGASVVRGDSPFLRDFVRYHLDDIRKFQPDFSLPSGDDVFALILTRDSLPAGLVVGRRQDMATLRIDLDYVLADYRDSRLGQWLYGPGTDVFRDANISLLVADATTDAHFEYLERAGFERRQDEFVLDL